jgi:4'-phosphopantetheinyl transferase
LAQLLARDEQARAERFHFERDRRRFIVARAALRTLAGRYLGLEPRCVQFRYGPYGKPYFSNDPDRSELRFNLAHSNELAVYAFACGREVGVDVEYLHPVPAAEQIAQQFFSNSEHASFRLLPDSHKLDAFFNCWTRKEAYIKALGEGLSHPLDQFQVSLIPDEPARLLKVDGFPAEVDRWHMTSFMPASGYVGALVAEGLDVHVEYWQLGRNTPQDRRCASVPSDPPAAGR